MAAPGPTLRWSPPVESHSPRQPANAQKKGFNRQHILLDTSIAAQHSVAIVNSIPGNELVSVQGHDTLVEKYLPVSLPHILSVESGW